MYKVVITINKNSNGKEIKEKTFIYRCYDYDFLDMNKVGFDCEDLCYRIYSKHQIVSLLISDVK